MTLMLRALSTFYPPQKPILFSGAGSIKRFAELMVQSGHKTPLIVADRFPINNGMFDGLISYLKEEGCTVIIFDWIVPNPTFKIVEAGVAASNNGRCDTVFAVGGGSAINVAKLVAAASTTQKSFYELAGILKVDRPPLPFYVAPTTSGTGSEATNAAVISAPDTHVKKFFVDPKYIPIAAALDPKRLKSLPAAITAATGVDALTHAIEAYTSQNRFADTNRDAALAIRLIFGFLPTAYVDGKNEKACEMVALDSFLAGFAFTKSRLGYVHAISHQISALYDTPHGLTNAIIVPRALLHNKSACAKRFAQLEAILNRETYIGSTSEMAERFIERVNILGRTLEIPDYIPSLKPKDFRKIAAGAIKEARWSYAVPQTMSCSNIEKILQSITINRSTPSMPQSSE